MWVDLSTADFFDFSCSQHLEAPFCTKHVKAKKWQSGDMAQWLWSLSCRHEYLSSNSQYPCKSYGMQCVSITHQWEVEVGDSPGLCWPASLLCQKKVEWFRKTSQYQHAHRYTRMHTGEIWSRAAQYGLGCSRICSTALRKVIICYSWHGCVLNRWVLRANCSLGKAEVIGPSWAPSSRCSERRSYWDVLGHALGVHLTSIQDLWTVWFWKHGVRFNASDFDNRS